MANKGDKLQNIELEESTIGAVFYNPALFGDVATFLKPEDFIIHRHRWIWQAFFDLAQREEPIDNITTSNELLRIGKLDEIGGDAYITKFLTAADTGLNIMAYAKKLKDFSLRRREAEKANEQLRKAYDLNTPLLNLDELATPKTHWTVAELMASEFPDPCGPVPGIIPAGLTILGGRPKAGKSWFMLQCAYTLSIGGKFLDYDLKTKRVLYYPLEDPPRRLKDRLAKLGAISNASLEFERNLQPLHLGGLAQIEGAADKFDMIVIDTLGRAMPGKDFSKDGAIFADIMGKIQTLATTKNISIVVLLHTRKPNGLEHDPVDDILGSTQGLTSTPDCVLALYKEPGKPGARLEGRSRDSEEVDLTLEFDPFTSTWQLLGSTNEIRLSDDEAEILEVLQDLGKAKAATIAKAIRKDRSNTAKRCANLWTKGKLKKDEMNGFTVYYLNTPYSPTQPTLPTQDTQPTLPTQGTQTTQT